MNAVSSEVDERLAQIFQAVKAEAPLRRRCDLLVSKRHMEPFIFTFHHAVIVIPVCMLDLPDEDLYFILKHEWQHHRDRDNQQKIAIEVLCCMLWWNPFVYLLRHNLSQVLELKCDRKIIKHMTEMEKLHYMESLLRVMRRSLEQTSVAVRCNVHTSIHFLGVSLPHNDHIDLDVIQRFDAVTAVGKPRWFAEFACVFCLLSLFFLCFGFVIQPYSLPPLETEDGTESEWADIQNISVTRENAYLTDNLDGTYLLYIDETLFQILGKEEARYEPYAALLIKQKQD